MTQKITEKTVIPISLVITLSTGIWWASGIEKRVEANTKDVSSVTEMQTCIADIKIDIAVIKNDLKKLVEAQTHRRR